MMTALKWTGCALMVLAIFHVTIALIDPRRWCYRQWKTYVTHLERLLRQLNTRGLGQRVAVAQGLVILAAISLKLSVGLPLWYAWVLLAAAGPQWYIARAIRRRTEAIDAQVESFLAGLANALKSTPSVTDAFVSLSALMPCPLREEIDLASKEIRVGSTLDQALIHMAGRVGGRRLDTALSAVLIGRQVGGNLPAILETTAASLRELSRLDGVVRAKTAEGKFQTIALAMVPFVLVIGLKMVNDHYFDPLTDTFIGWCICVAAGIGWVASLIAARRVLAVDV